ncbi:MAG: UDP-N-acetylmuramoyl-L-alanyl-D-glutamate--2,6-diaminopimelate ligase [Acidobacteriota bacterium]|nr:UDP-N-acetylmuramoyl-L-alanyl-D-glutamate--2,6-diaminopimelate ligase [Acidobacteriota bacterium]
MKVNTLLKRLREGKLTGDGTVDVKGVTHDSRLVRSGSVFAAIPGGKVHGVHFVDQAIDAGAAAVLSDRRRPKRIDVPWIKVKQVRPVMARAAWILAGNPQNKLGMIGITGTNGKSTTAHLISLILNAAGHPTVFVGTLGIILPDGTEIASERTTPEATDLAPILRQALKAGADNVAMEVSSHALCQDRIAGIEFDVAVWTNLTRDHLDYHGEMESYFEAKRRLFTEHLAAGGRRVLPVDDPWGARLLDEQRDGDISWGLDRGAVCARMVISGLEGSRFDLRLPETELAVRLPLIGVNILRKGLAAAAAARAAGLGPKAIRRGLKRARPLSGRLERVKTKLPFPIFVDYAHTPEGLRSVLQALDRITDRRLIVVFGAGGDRDRGKRGPMGYAVGELADVPVVTSDNPRSEDPAAIAEAVADGVRAAGAEPLVVLDRKEAIRTALEMADERSLVLVAGKGHEAYQAVGDKQTPFSDQNVLRSLSRRLR